MPIVGEAKPNRGLFGERRDRRVSGHLRRRGDASKKIRWTVRRGGGSQENLARDSRNSRLPIVFLRPRRCSVSLVRNTQPASDWPRRCLVRHREAKPTSSCSPRDLDMSNAGSRRRRPRRRGPGGSRAFSRTPRDRPRPARPDATFVTRRRRSAATAFRSAAVPIPRPPVRGSRARGREPSAPRRGPRCR